MSIRVIARFVLSVSIVQYLPLCVGSSAPQRLQGFALSATANMTYVIERDKGSKELWNQGFYKDAAAFLPERIALFKNEHYSGIDCVTFKKFDNARIITYDSSYYEIISQKIVDKNTKRVGQRRVTPPLWGVGVGSVAGPLIAYGLPGVSKLYVAVSSVLLCISLCKLYQYRINEKKPSGGLVPLSNLKKPNWVKHEWEWQSLRHLYGIKQNTTDEWYLYDSDSSYSVDNQPG